jgi:hypothetical protein
VTRVKLSYWAAWLGVGGTAAVAALIVPAASSTGSTSCPPGVAIDRYYPEPRPSPAKVEFVPVPDGSKVKLRFNDSHRPLKREFLFALAAGAPDFDLNALNNPSGLNARMFSQRLTGPRENYIWPIGHGVQLSLELLSSDNIGICFRLDPNEMTVPPGTYHGTVGVAFKDQMRTSVGVEASFRESWKRAALIAFLGAFLGVVVKALSEAAAIARSRGTSGWQALRDYTWQLTFVVTVILAVISGIFTYVALYAHDPDWGADANDGLKLFAACFIVQMSSSEALGVIVRFAGGGQPTLPTIPRPS